MKHIALSSLLLLLLTLLPQASAQQTLIVSPEGPYHTIVEALADAQAGDCQASAALRNGRHDSAHAIEATIAATGRQMWA